MLKTSLYVRLVRIKTSPVVVVSSKAITAGLISYGFNTEQIMNLFRDRLGKSLCRNFELKKSKDEVTSLWESEREKSRKSPVRSASSRCSVDPARALSFMQSVAVVGVNDKIKTEPQLRTEIPSIFLMVVLKQLAEQLHLFWRFELNFWISS